MPARRIDEFGDEDARDDFVGLLNRMEAFIEQMLIEVDDAFSRFADIKELAPKWGSQEILAMKEVGCF